MNVLAFVWWVIVLAGLIPTSWFLLRFRPRWPIRSPSLIINGVVLAAWIGYVRSAWTVAASGWVPTFRAGVIGTTVNLGLGAVVDGIVILMLIKFLEYRKQWESERSGETGEGG